MSTSIHTNTPSQLPDSLNSKDTKNLHTRVKRIINTLSKMYPKPETPLYHKDVFQLLIAAILSAQMQDARLNLYLPKLFKEYPDPKRLANASISKLHELLKGVNYYKTKAKHIKKTAQLILTKFGGKVPNTIEDLTALPGVGRKTANVVLTEGLNTPQGIVVDTHVKRLSQRLGLTQHNDPKQIEQDLIRVVPKKYWRYFSLRLIFYGREICKAQRPRCEQCPFTDICHYYKQNQPQVRLKKSK